jgi:hypothetical protein
MTRSAGFQPAYDTQNPATLCNRRNSPQAAAKSSIPVFTILEFLFYSIGFVSDFGLRISDFPARRAVFDITAQSQCISAFDAWTQAGAVKLLAPIGEDDFWNRGQDSIGCGWLGRRWRHDLSFTTYARTAQTLSHPP